MAGQAALVLLFSKPSRVLTWGYEGALELGSSREARCWWVRLFLQAALLRPDAELADHQYKGRCNHGRFSRCRHCWWGSVYARARRSSRCSLAGAPVVSSVRRLPFARRRRHSRLCSRCAWCRCAESSAPRRAGVVALTLLSTCCAKFLRHHRWHYAAWHAKGSAGRSHRRRHIHHHHHRRRRLALGGQGTGALLASGAPKALGRRCRWARAIFVNAG